MYGELVKRLREADVKSMCGECGLNLHTGATKKGVLFAEAADAIAELSKPRWIPVTEGLPKTRASILGKKSSKVIVAFRFDDGTQGTDTAHTLNGEWVFEDHITVVERTITHWQPLPEPPKEEA